MLSVKAWCPECDTLQVISPTGLQIPGVVGGSASYKRLDLHKHPLKAKVCAGSGRLV